MTRLLTMPSASGSPLISTEDERKMVLALALALALAQKALARLP